MTSSTRPTIPFAFHPKGRGELGRERLQGGCVTNDGSPHIGHAHSLVPLSLRPLPVQQALLDPIRMKHVVHHDMPKQDEERVVAVLLMLGRTSPVAGPKLPQARDQLRPLPLETLESLVEVDCEQRLWRMLSLRKVRANRRTLFTQEQGKPLEEHGLDSRKVARMLVSGPLAWAWASLPEVFGHFANQRNDDRRRPLESVYNLVVRQFSHLHLQSGARESAEIPGTACEAPSLAPASFARC
jgi:hypothetical protein